MVDDPLDASITFNEKLYVSTQAFASLKRILNEYTFERLAGIVTEIGDRGIGDVYETLLKLDIAGVPAKTEYSVGVIVPLVTVYGILKLVAAIVTFAIEPIVIDGNGFTVTVVAVDVALQPLALVTVTL